jgi:riboflavin kinase/FMN adenylyltransferase
LKIFENLNTNKNLSLALGFFDGVHKAHQKLIGVTVELAHKNNLKSAVITFKNNPLCDFRGIEATYIYNNAEKFRLIEELGIDYIYLLDFKEFANLSAEEYLKDILYKNFTPKFITTGFNHNFGKNKSGDHIFLRNNQEKYGYIYNEIPPIKEKNKL